MITEEIQKVGKRENIHCSAKQYKHLLIATNRVLDGNFWFFKVKVVEADTGLRHTHYKQGIPLSCKGRE